MTSRERGSGSVLLLVLLAVLGLGALTAVSVVAVTVSRHRAQSAADLAALAAASARAHGEDIHAACRVAAAVARSNRAELVACRPSGDSMLVAVRTRAPVGALLGGRRWTEAQARAGPEPRAGG